jgi:putative Mg2+ transporter-C (MgtC) family protein
MSFETIFLRMGLSMLFGVLVGWERQLRNKPAGIRTIALVCMGSTLMMLLAVEIDGETQGGPSDVLRMLQGIVTGIGFLGAGTVIQDNDKVRGLTTAAAIWMIAAVGAAIGAGYYTIAVVGEALTVGLIAIKGKD